MIKGHRSYHSRFDHLSCKIVTHFKTKLLIQFSIFSKTHKLCKTSIHFIWSDGFSSFDFVIEYFVIFIKISLISFWITQSYCFDFDTGFNVFRSNRIHTEIFGSLFKANIMWYVRVKRQRACQKSFFASAASPPDP